MVSALDPDDDVRALRQRLNSAEAKVAELGAWLEVMLQNPLLGVGVISALENRYVRANAALAELYDLSVSEILSTDPFALALKLTHPDDLVNEQDLFAQVVAGKRRSYEVDKRFVRRDGSFRTGRLCFSGIFADPVDPGAEVGPLQFAIVQVLDIHEQRALLETLERRETELRHAQKVDGIGRLAAGIAHDFNNLLTVILGHGEVLKSLLAERASAQGEVEPQPDLEAILAASERAATLTAQLLTHGRRDTVRPKTFVLSEAVQTLQQLLGRVIGSNIEVEQALHATGAIFADQGHVGQVVMNLILNARDAIADVGKIGLETRDVQVPEGSTETPGPGGWVALEVSDSGQGMSPEVQARMFEPFFTTRPDRPGTQGTGLGLATVQRIVSELGGHIQVKSALGAGTSVTVFFPRAASAPKPVVASKIRERPALTPTPNKWRVLVVEDEPAVRSLVGTTLLGAHYRVMVARNGEEALRFIAQQAEPFHLIVTDLMMPSISGATLAKTLSERGSAPRMLFISGYSHHTIDELSVHGTFLPKPFTPAQLLRAVEDALEGATG